MRFILPLFLLAVLYSCKTKVTTGSQLDVFPSTANLSYSAFQSLYTEGIDLYAYSQEAGWKLRIDLGNRAIFTGSDGSDRVFTFQPGMNYTAELNEPFVFNDGTNNMSVQFRPAPCEDAANRYTSMYTVEIAINEVLYRGCGLNVFDKRVNGTWKLYSVADIPADKGTRDQHSITIDADKGITGSIFDCDSVSYRTTFRAASVVFEQSFRKVVKKCKAKAPSTLINKIPSFTGYDMEGDSMLVLKDTEEKRYRFVRK